VQPQTSSGSWPGLPFDERAPLPHLWLFAAGIVNGWPGPEARCAWRIEPGPWRWREAVAFAAPAARDSACACGDNALRYIESKGKSR
jgi:hypothetical protein